MIQIDYSPWTNAFLYTQNSQIVFGKIKITLISPLPLFLPDVWVIGFPSELKIRVFHFGSKNSLLSQSYPARIEKENYPEALKLWGRKTFYKIYIKISCSLPWSMWAYEPFWMAHQEVYSTSSHYFFHLGPYHSIKEVKVAANQN